MFMESYYKLFLYFFFFFFFATFALRLHFHEKKITEKNKISSFSSRLHRINQSLCHILQDIGDHGLPLLPITCSSYQLHCGCHSSTCLPHQTIQVFLPRSSPPPPTLYHSSQCQIIISYYYLCFLFLPNFA